MSQKQLMVNLGFTADTASAKKAIQDLQNQLTQLTTNPVGIGNKMTSEIQQATHAAAELKVHLQNATNVDTGNLDFGKLNQSLKKSGISLSEYASKLQRLGPQGQQAFMSLANSVAMAEVPLRRANSTLTGLMTTLKNTAKWQISSSVLHGFIGAISEAHNYAKDLNKSLTDIRIVSGQSVDQMAKFAKTANQAAKALSTTTTEYANASLIFYQQGLSDKEVQERANVTIKMANATGQSAQVVSDQLTAIWNNFNKAGDESYEKFADILTALGAATASSTDEIAQGLEKFAAVSETVQLSYEYAASALATVTATTRQSADVVGTAFKTLFARIEGLKLGETLDDGTTFNQYSEALMAVGVNIKNSQGDLKDMDTILKEMATVWKTLEKDEQVALAQKVAGVRQYTQLIALMDNWDFMEENLETSYAATGELSKQAAIYAESWEAASKRVQASAESIYASLFDDQFFIGLTNGLSGAIDLVGQFVEGIGGLGGVLSGLGLILTKVFGEQMAQGFRDMAYNIKANSTLGAKMIQDQKAQQMKQFSSMMATSDASTATEIQTKQIYEQELQLQSELIENAEKMTSEERQKYQILLQQHKVIGEQSIELTKQGEQLKSQADSISTEFIGQGMLKGQSYQDMSGAMSDMRLISSDKASFDSFLDVQDIISKGDMTEQTFNRIKSALQSLGASKESLQEISDGFVRMGAEGERTTESVQEFQALLSGATTQACERFATQLEAIGASGEDIQIVKQAFVDIQSGGEKAAQGVEKIQSVIAKLKASKIKDILTGMGFKEGTVEYENAAKKLQEYGVIQEQIIVNSNQQKNTNDNLKSSFKSLREAISSVAKESGQDWANHLTTMTSSLMSLGMLISSINSLKSQIEDPDSSGWEKFGAILTSVSMIAMSLGGTFKGLQAAGQLLQALKNKDTIITMANVAASYLQAKASKDVADSKREETAAIEENSNATKEETVDKLANAGADKIDFKGKQGRSRSYSGKKNLKGQLLDDNGDVIADKYVQKYNLNDFGKTPGGGNAPKAAPKAGAGGLNPGTLSTLGSAAASVAVIAAAVAIAAVAITAGIEAMNTAEEKFETASLTAEALSKSAESARASLEQLSNAFDDLDSKKQTLATLTEGTSEYTAALQESNAAVLDLINSTDGLTMADLEVDDKGVYSISKEAEARVLNEQIKESGIKQSASLKAEANKQQASQELDVDTFLEKQHKEELGANIAIGTAAGAGIGAALGTVIPGIGNAVGAAAGAIAGAGLAIGGALVATGSKIDKQAEAFDDLDFSTMDTEMEKLTAAAKALGINFDGTEAGFSALDESIQKEIEALVANKEATDKNTAALLREATKAGFEDEFSDLSDSEKNLASDTISEDVKETSDAVKAQLDKRWESKLHGSEYDEAAAMLGYAEGTEIKAIKGEDGVTRYTAVDSSGETIEELGTVDAITTRIAEEYALKAAKGEDMSMYSKDKASDALGGKSVTDFDKDYQQGVNQGEKAAEKFDYNLEGTAKEMFDEGVSSEQLSAEDFKGENGDNIIAGIQAVADANEKFTEKDFEANKEAVTAYYKALFGEDADLDPSTIVSKLNAIKQEGEEAAEKADEAGAKAIAQEAVSEGLIESAEAFEAYTDAMLTAEQKSKLTKEAQAQLAKSLLKVQNGYNKAAEGLDEYNEALESGDEIAKATAMGKLAKGLNEAFGEDTFDAEKIEKHMELIKKALAGDAQAFDDLREAISKEYLVEVGVNVKDEGFGQEINEWIGSQEFDDLEVGATLDSTGMYEAFQGLLDSGAVTADQMNKILSNIGFAPKIEYKEMTLAEAKKAKQTSYIMAADGTYTEVTSEMDLKDDAKVWVPVINAEETTFTAPPKISAPSGKGGGGGGGGSKPKKTSDSRKNKSEMVDRYKEINDQLEETERQMNKVSIAAEGLWGKDRIAKLKENIKYMKQEVSQLKEKERMAKNYLKIDKQDLQKKAGVGRGKEADEARKAFGMSVDFSFDENGYITNYTDLMTQLYNKREALLDSFGAEMDEKEQERLEEFDKAFDNLKSAYEQYETTLDERDDFEEERLQKILDIQTAYYDALNEELEIKISIDEDALETIEYYLSKIEDDFYQMFEAAALMIGDASSLEQGQIKHYLSEVDSQQKYVEDLDKAHTTVDPKTGETEINDAQYMEGLRQAKTDTIASLQALQDLDKTMMHYYGDTLAAASEELSKYTTLMEHQTSVLDHYKNIMDILGQGKDYKKMGVILDAQAKTIGNEAKVAKENYNMLKEQAEARKAEYDQAVAQGLAQSEIDAYKQRWMDAENAANEAQENMLSKTEAWAEAMKAVVENKLNDLDQTLENALTADFGGSFDLMNSAFERANSLQEEFLTTTNKIYETNKLMRQAQQEIDKTSNEVAKKRLKQFINETNQLQNKNKLSNYELEIQQAKYDLALAQIALEEAQNAKSTVRLQRDAEGNFGYVYTADQNAVAEAQQKFEDAQNSLYNIGLEGANSYAEKYQQTLSEFYSTMTELQHQYLAGEFENDAEYQEAMLAAREYYYEKLQQYSSLYTVAINTDTRVVADAWSTQYANMTQNTEEWMFNIDSYVEGVKVAFGEWETQMAQIEEETIGPDLDALTERTKTLTGKSQELADTILDEGGVLDAIEQEVTQVAELTGAYAGLREEIQEAIRQREELIRQIDERIQNENEGEDGDGSGGGGDGGSGGGGDGSGGGNGNLDPKDASTKRGVALAIWNGSYGWGTGKTRKNRLKEKGFDPDEIQDLVNDTDPSAGWGSRYGITDLSKYAYSKFDTGGYTGAWGANGKFAMLHEKELVLNKGDTENFLASMELLDTIVKTIDLHSTNAALGGLLNSPYLNGMNNNEVLEQNVTIEANFPNVSSRTEIEEAFTTLVNRASQYANRK